MQNEDINYNILVFSSIDVLSLVCGNVKLFGDSNKSDNIIKKNRTRDMI